MGVRVVGLKPDIIIVFAFNHCFRFICFVVYISREISFPFHNCVISKRSQ